MMYSASNAGKDALTPAVYLEQSGRVVTLEYAGEPLITLLTALDRIRDDAAPRPRFRQHAEARWTRAEAPARKVPL